MCWCTFQPGTFAGWGYEGVKLHFHIHGCGAGMQTAGHAVGWSCVSMHTSTIRRSLPFAEHNILIKNSLADLKTTSVHARRKPNENYCSMHRHFPEVLHFQQEVQEKAWERKHAPPTLRQQRHSQPLPGVKGLQDLRWQPDEWKDATLSHICDFSTSQLLLWHCNHASGKQHSPRIKWNNQGPVLPACVPQRSWQGTSALAKFSRMMPVSTLIHTVWAVQL